ncbi:MAG TPA: DUF4034 domain-containing protein [Abditibacterium sp.]
MLISLSRFLLLAPLLAVFSGCNRAQNAPDSPFLAQEASASNPSRAAFSRRMADLDKRGDFVGMVAAARAQLAGDASDSSAQFALARGSYFNGDFALATTELSKLTQAPPFAQDAEALEMLRVSSYLNGRYAGQKFPPVQSVPGDVAQQSQEAREQGAALIAAKKYDEIEEFAAAQTKNPTIMSDGGWILAPFFVGLWDGASDSETEAEWQPKHAQVEVWQRARPTSQLAQISLARSWTNGAWVARGDDYSNKVSSSAWKTVEERQQKAAPIYRKLLNGKVSSPLVYAAAQRYGRLGSAPRDWHDKILQRAVAQFPTYTDFYRERAIYLLPRWNGEPGEWESDLAKSADAEAARAGAAAGDRLYARVAWDQEDFYANMQRQTKIDWPRAKRGFEAILAQHPNSLSAATRYMRFCYAWNEGAKARELLQIVGGRAENTMWNTPRRFAEARITILRLTS